MWLSIMHCRQQLSWLAQPALPEQLPAAVSKGMLTSQGTCSECRRQCVPVYLGILALLKQSKGPDGGPDGGLTCWRQAQVTGTRAVRGLYPSTPKSTQAQWSAPGKLHWVHMGTRRLPLCPRQGHQHSTEGYKVCTPLGWDFQVLLALQPRGFQCGCRCKTQPQMGKNNSRKVTYLVHRRALPTMRYF